MKKLLPFLFLIFSSQFLFSQTSDTTVYGCELTIQGTDLYGEIPYLANIDTSITIISENSTFLGFDFWDKDLGTGDTLFIYGGPDFNSPLLRIFTDTGSAYPFEDDLSVVTIRLKSDGAVNGLGFQMYTYCYPLLITSIDNSIITPGEYFNPTIHTLNINGYEVPRLALIIGADTLWDESPIDSVNQLKGSFFIDCSVIDNPIKRLEIYDMELFNAADSTSLSITPPVVIDSIVVTDPNCFGAWDGSAEAFVSGGVPPYSYQWGGGAYKLGDNNQVNMSPNIYSNINANSYSLNVYDNNGCNVSQFFTLTNPPELFVNGGNDTTICQASSANLQASAFGGTGAYLFEWFTDPSLFDNGNGSATVNPTESMAYTIKVTDEKLCTTQTQVNVNLFSSPTADAGLDTVFCVGGTATLYGYDEGMGFTPYWSSTVAINNQNSFTASATPDTTTEFVLTITDGNGCSNHDTVVVFVNQKPVFIAPPNQNVCFPSSVSLSVNSDDYTIDYNWSPATFLNSTNGVSVIASPDTNITYTVIGTSLEGCNDTQIVNLTRVEKPVAIITAPSEACLFSNVSFNSDLSISNAGSLTVTNWSFGDGGFSTLFDPSRTFGVSDTFNIYMQAVNDVGCSDDTTVSLIIRPLDNASFTGLNIEYCANDTNWYTLTPNVSGGTFVGNGILNNSEFNPSQVGGPGNYIIEYQITNAYGCFNSSTASVQINNPPLANVNGLADYCTNQSEIILSTFNTGGTFGGSASVAINGDTLKPNLLTAGLYTLDYTVNNGTCESTNNYSFYVHPSPEGLIYSLSNISCDGTSGTLGVDITFSVGSTQTYSWHVNGANTWDNTAYFGSNGVTITDDSTGCILMLDTTIANFPAINVDSINFINPHCNLYDGSITVYVSGGAAPYSYIWPVNTDTTSTLDSIRADIYNLHIGDANGCFLDTSIELTYQGYYPNIVGNVTISGNTLTQGGEIHLYEVTDLGAYNKVSTFAIAANGNYAIYAIPASKYIIMAVADSVQYPNAVVTYYGNTHRWEQTPFINIGCSADTSISIDVINLLPPPGNGTITGVVTDVTVRDSTDTLQGGRLRKPGEPIRGIDIILEDVPGGNISMRTTTDTSGLFTFENVPPNNYRIYVGIPGCGMLATYDLSVGASGEFYYEKDFYVDSVAGTIDTATTVRIPLSLQIADNNSSAGYNVYPNPFNDKISLSMYSLKVDNYEILIYNVNGAKVLSEKGTLVKGRNDVTLNVDTYNLSKGIYFLEIKQDNVTPVIIKLIKE